MQLLQATPLHLICDLRQPLGAGDKLILRRLARMLACLNAVAVLGLITPVVLLATQVWLIVGGNGLTLNVLSGVAGMLLLQLWVAGVLQHRCAQEMG